MSLTLILPFFATFLAAYGYIDKKPGNIPGSYNLYNDTWACPIVEETAGVEDEKVKGQEILGEVTLKVTHCYQSSWKVLQCPSYNDPQYFTLSRNPKTGISEAGTLTKSSMN